MIRLRLKTAASRVAVMAALMAAVPSLALPQSAVQVDVPAQPLSAAIAELGRETGFQIGITSALSAGKQSTTVRGVMTPRQALDVLLQGTGLKADFLGADGATISQAVSSQLATGDDELIGEDIIVQGELQARSLQDTQTSVIVITGEELERRSDKDIYDIYQRTAGVTPGTNGRDLVIRGIQRNGLGFGGGATISTRIDGADVSSAGRFRNLDFSTWDLEQVEIFRGPQSTQSGRNALAGVVDIRSKDPVFDFEAKARAEFGSGPTGAAAFAVNVPIVEDTLALRVSVDRDQSAGFIENTTRQSDNYGDSELTTLRGSVRFDPFDTLSTVLKYTYVREERGGESLDGARFQIRGSARRPSATSAPAKATP
ncbi:MAG: TonB-dependent receptor [Pseudomonadota bacterium]